MSTPGNRAAAIFRKTELAKAAIANALLAAAHEYANGGNRAEPIVRRHFTAGNVGRYGWQPLSPKYARRKAFGTEKTVGGVVFLNAKQRAGLAGFMASLQGVTGAARRAARAGFISQLRGGKAASKSPKGEPSLPVLVLTGALRDAIAGGRALVIPLSPSSVRILWRGVPEYGGYHHTGAIRLPKRSPIEPNAEDRAAIVEAARRYLSAALATGVPVASFGGGRARVVP